MFRPGFALALLAAGVPALSAAETPSVTDRLTQCLAEADSLRRLSCFEALARSVQSAPPAARVLGQEAAPDPAREGPPAAAAARGAPTGPARDDRPAAQTPGLDAERLPSGVRVARDSDGRPMVIGEWVISRSTDSMTDRPRVTLMTEGEMEAGRDGLRAPALMVRCFNGRLEIFWDSGQFIGTRDTFTTTLRFDDGQPQQQRWTSSTSGRSVFAPNAPLVMNSLVAARERLLIETVAFSGERYRARFDIEGIRDAAAEVAACWRPPQPQGARPQGQPQRPAAPGGAAR
jgi:hypothetical protein